MFLKKKELQILAEKPDIFGDIPENILSEEKINELKRIPRIAVGEVTGPESLKAIFHVLRKIEADAFLPSLAYTGTEYGSWRALDDYLLQFKKNVEKNLRVFVIDPVILGSPNFWWALNGRFGKDLRERFKFFIPCLGCQLYLHALRVPLCKKINARLLIYGDTGYDKTHGTIFQKKTAMYYYKTLLSSFGIDCLTPL